MAEHACFVGVLVRKAVPDRRQPRPDRRLRELQKSVNGMNGGRVLLDSTRGDGTPLIETANVASHDLGCSWKGGVPVFLAEVHEGDPLRCVGVAGRPGELVGQEVRGSRCTLAVATGVAANGRRRACPSGGSVACPLCASRRAQTRR